MRKSLRSAKAYGSDAVLLVPCRIDAKGMPAIADIVIDFDPASGHVKSVVKGDNAPHEEYIKAHNFSIDASRAAVEKLIPLAEELKVVIGYRKTSGTISGSSRRFTNISWRRSKARG